MASANRPVIHGQEHQPRGADPSRTERWHKCGDPGEPPINPALNGRAWFRGLVGPIGHEQSSIEVMIAIDGGADGDVIFTLPVPYFNFAGGEKIPASGHDSMGLYRAWYLDGANGNVVLGPIPL